MTLLVALFVANATAHFVSYLKLRQNKAPNALGVLAFVFINAIIAVILWQELNWGEWLALVFPAIGGLGLLLTTILKGKGTWIDYIIFVLDIMTVTLVVKNYIL